MGVIPEWFHFDWLAGAARALPNVSFVLVGPERLARARLGGLANVHALGTRDYAAVPAYLQHAQAGLMPFDAARNPEGVAALNPQKMYAYLASGLPVVSADWEEMHGLGSPVCCCASGTEFVSALRRVLTDPGPAEGRRRFAARHAWRARIADLLGALADLDSSFRGPINTENKS
jgi:glycosyltransferase involved in cell wall biosynthesis